MINKFIKENFFLILVFCLALLLRIYHLDRLYVFTTDEEYQTELAMTLVRNLHIIWIGVSAANTGFYLGPYWTYFTAFWLYLSRGDPLITAYIAAIIGALTCSVIFWVGRKMFSLRVGLVASVLYATLPLIVFFDQKYWNPSTVPLLSIMMIYSLYRVKDDQKYWLFFALSYGLVFHTHLSLVPFIFIALYQLRKGIKARVLLMSICVFLVTVLPLIFFDYFHKFSNITVFLRVRQIASAFHQSIMNKAVSLIVTVGRLWFIAPNSINANELLGVCEKYRNHPSVISVPFLMIIILFLFRKKTWVRENYRIVALGILVISFSFLIYPGDTNEYYLLGLFPLLVFIPGIIWNKYLSPLLITIMCILGIAGVITTHNPYGLIVKKEIIYEVMSKLGNHTYELTETEEEGVCHKFEGWRYLFATYGRIPERSSMDSSHGWLYPDQIHNIPVDYSVTITGYEIGNLGFSWQIIKNQ